jgi:hypothetical protein
MRERRGKMTAAEPHHPCKSLLSLSGSLSRSVALHPHYGPRSHFIRTYIYSQPTRAIPCHPILCFPRTIRASNAPAETIETVERLSDFSLEGLDIASACTVLVPHPHDYGLRKGAW